MRPLVVFAASVAVFHNVPGVAGGAGDWIDLATPFVVLAAAAAALAALGSGGISLGLALAAGIAYVDGHGIHLAANSIRAETLAGEAEDVAYFWDEQFSHWEWHLGLLGLVVAFCLAEASTRPAPRGRPAAGPAVAALLGFTLFTSTVEGQTWWLLPPAAAGLAVWWFARPRPVLAASAGAFALAGVLLAAWAVWQGGVPEFSDVGWL